MSTIIPATVPFKALVYFPAREGIPEQVLAHNVIAWRIDTHDDARPVPITVMGMGMRADAVEDLGAGCVTTSTGEWFKDRAEWIEIKRAG